MTGSYIGPYPGACFLNQILWNIGAPISRQGSVLFLSVLIFALHHHAMVTQLLLCYQINCSKFSALPTQKWQERREWLVSYVPTMFVFVASYSLHLSVHLQLMKTHFRNLWKRRSSSQWRVWFSQQKNDWEHLFAAICLTSHYKYSLIVMWNKMKNTQSR